MAKYKIILISVACFSVVVLADQRPLYMPPKLPPLKPGMTPEEYHQEVEKAIEQQRREQRERDKEYMDLMSMQAWMRLLRVSEQQWKNIEPKYRKENDLAWEIWTGAPGSGGRNEHDFHWHRRSKGNGSREAKAPDEMTEGERIVEALTDLLENKDATNEQIRKQIHALQQAREKAKKELPKAKQELAKVLATPRQEAIFLILGHID